MAATLPPPLPPPNAVKTTPAQLSRWALMSLGRLGATQPLEGEDLQTCFEMLNGMVDAWKINELTCDYISRATCQLQPDKTIYTVGPGGDFDVAFPPQIYYGSMLLNFESGTALERPIGPPRPIQNLPAGVQINQVKSDFPDRFFYQPYYENPSAAQTQPGCGLISFYPTPDNNRHLFCIWFPQMLDIFIDPLAEYYLRPGMMRALRTNLAIEVAPLFQAEPPPTLRVQARAALDAIQIVGGKPNEMIFDPQLLWWGPTYNIYSDM